MAWTKGIVIRGGMYEGSTIGISELFPPNVDFYYIQANNNVNESHSETIYNTTTPDFFVSDFDNYINVSSIFSKSSPDFADECIADIAIMNGKTLKGYYSLYATKDGGDPKYMTIMGKIKNASGVVLGDFHGSGSISIQMGSYGDNPIVYLSLAKTTYNDHTIYGLFFNFCQVWRYGSGSVFKQYVGAFIDDDTISSYWNIDGKIDSDVKTKSPEFGPVAKTGGGYNEDIPASGKGSFDDSSDIITPSSKPTLTPLSSNLVHAYKVTTQILNDIADAIYVDLANDWSSIETALEAIFNAIFSAKYVDFLLDLLILPIDVPAPNLVNVKVGGKYLTLSKGRVQAHLVTDPYVDFDCGSITIPEYWANFLDYTGTKVKLFLPYIGYVDIQPEYIISGELNVKYRFNVLDGSFIVYVMSSSGKSELTSSMIGQYSGVAAVHVPLQASDYATKVSGLISAIGTVAAGMAAGGVGAMSGAANLGNTLMQKPGSTHANGYNASSSYLSHRCPYLIIERQVSQFSQKYPEEVGLPLNVMRTLGSMVGLTKCEAAHLDTIPCSIDGKKKISQLLAEGIIL